MAARSQAHEVKQHLDEVKSLRERLGTARWREEDWAIVDRVLESYEQLLSMLFEAQLTLTRLQTLLFGKRRRRRNRVASGPPETPEGVADTRGEAVVGEVCDDAMTRRADARSASSMGALENEGKPSRAGGIVRVLAALGLTPMRVPSTWSAITRSWLSASAVRCVGRAVCMRYRPG